MVTAEQVKAYRVIERGIVKRASGFVFNTTTPGADLNSLLGRMHLQGLKTNTGEAGGDERLLFVWYGAGPEFEDLDEVGHVRVGGAVAQHETFRIGPLGQPSGQVGRRVGEPTGDGGVGDRPEHRDPDRAPQVAGEHDGGGDDPGGDAGPAGVGGADHPGGRVGEDDRHAVGGTDEEDHVGPVGDDAVALGPGLVGSGRHDVVAVDLAEVGDGAAGGEVVEQEREVALGHRPLAGLEERQVERVERRAADPAVPVGEGQLDGAEARAVVVQGRRPT